MGRSAGRGVGRLSRLRLRLAVGGVFRRSLDLLVGGAAVVPVVIGGL